MSDYQPRIGEIGLVSTRGFIGFLIQLGTFSKLNHAFIYEGNNTIIEATPLLGVKRSPVNTYQNIVWSRHVDFTPEQGLSIATEAGKHVGAKYFYGDFGILAARILHLPLPKFMLKRLATSKKYICSQLAAHCWRSAGLSIVPEKPEYFVTPSDIGLMFWYT